MTPVGESTIDVAAPSRLVFDPVLTLKEDDLYIESVTDTIYLKIDMAGTGTTTPILKTYAVRLKLI